MARILLIAYACDAEDVSETWCSHQWVRRFAQRHDATVLVYNRRRRRGAAPAQLPGARVIEWSEPALLERLGTFNDTVKPGYAHFYVCARRAIARLLRAERFDLVHQLEPFAPRYPSPAAGLGLPLVLGPVGGAVATPDGFRDELGRSVPWHARLRAFDRARFRFDPLLRHTYRSADVVLGVAPYVRELLGDVPLRRFEILSRGNLALVEVLLAREGLVGKSCFGLCRGVFAAHFGYLGRAERCENFARFYALSDILGHVNHDAVAERCDTRELVAVEGYLTEKFALRGCARICGCSEFHTGFRNRLVRCKADLETFANGDFRQRIGPAVSAFRFG